METKAGAATGISLAVALIAYVGFSGGGVNFLLGDEPQMPAAESPALGHPCLATIRQGMTSATMSPERCVTVAVSQ